MGRVCGGAPAQRHLPVFFFFHLPLLYDSRQLEPRSHPVIVLKPLLTHAAGADGVRPVERRGRQRLRFAQGARALPLLGGAVVL